MPGWLYLPFNHEGLESDQIIRDERDLLNRHVQHIRGTVTRIDTQNRELHVHYSPGLDEITGTGGAVEATYGYDYLVLATGARLAPEDLSGLSEANGNGRWHHFYSAEGALHLRHALSALRGRAHRHHRGRYPLSLPARAAGVHLPAGRVVDKHDLRSKTELQYLFPLPRVFPIESVAEAVTPLLEERHIGYTVFFNAETVDTEKKIISSMEGEEIPYDLLVLVPPHRGARVIEDSGLGDEQGWIPTDRHTLEVKGQQHVYALGDATDLPVSKSGSAAHFEAKIVAARILAAIRGEEPQPRRGHLRWRGDVLPGDGVQQGDPAGLQLRASAAPAAAQPVLPHGEAALQPRLLAHRAAGPGLS